MNKDKYLETDTILANTTFWGRVQKYNSSDIEKKHSNLNIFCIENILWYLVLGYRTYL